MSQENPKLEPSYKEALYNKMFSPVDIIKVAEEYDRLCKLTHQLMFSIPMIDPNETNTQKLWESMIKTLDMYNLCLQELFIFNSTHVPHMINYLHFIDQQMETMNEIVEMQLEEMPPKEREFLEKLRADALKYLAEEKERG